MARAKLLYKGVSYSDEDLTKVAIKEATFRRGKYKGYKLDRKNNVMIVINKTDEDDEGFLIHFDELKMYKVGEVKDSKQTLIFQGIEYPEVKLMKIGFNVACGMGAREVVDYKIDRRRKVVTYNCVFSDGYSPIEVDFYDLGAYNY